MILLLQAAEDDYKNAFRIDPNHGDIIINGPLDYERHNFYEFSITAKVKLCDIQ